MATYNGARYLREQVESILCELSEEDELIVSDDCSSDATRSIIEAFDDKRIRFYMNGGKHGVMSNFANALGHARGEIIFLADQDDVWMAGKVAQCVEALKEADLVFHNAILTDKDLIPQNKTLFSELKVKKGFGNNFVRNRFTGCCMAFRREILDYCLPMPTNVGFLHDNWIGLMVSLKGRVALLSTPLIMFRRHDSNASSAVSESRLSLGEKLAYRLSLGYNIIKRMCKG